MKRYVKPNQLTDLSGLEPPPLPDPLISDISVDSLIGDGLLVLYREMRQLKALSVSGKLDANSSRDLRDHLKLLFEIKDRESGLLKDLTDERLAAMLEKVKSGDK